MKPTVFASDAKDALFFRLSQALTGEPRLDTRLVPGLLERISSTPESSHLGRLLATYGEIAGLPEETALIRDRIMKDPDLHALARMTIVLWYTGDLLTAARDPSPATEEQYFGGVLWRIARAHPPGLSGGYFGHWTYPPDSG